MRPTVHMHTYKSQTSKFERMEGKEQQIRIAAAHFQNIVNICYANGLAVYAKARIVYFIFRFLLFFSQFRSLFLWCMHLNIIQWVGKERNNRRLWLCRTAFSEQCKIFSEKKIKFIVCVMQLVWLVLVDLVFRRTRVPLCMRVSWVNKIAYAKTSLQPKPSTSNSLLDQHLSKLIQ